MLPIMILRSPAAGGNFVRSPHVDWTWSNPFAFATPPAALDSPHTARCGIAHHLRMTKTAYASLLAACPCIQTPGNAQQPNIQTP